MAYIGSPVQQVLSRPTSQSFNGDGSTTVFTLNRSVNVSEELEVFVSNVQQEPGVGKSYTANGTSLTFDEAPPSGTGNIYVIYRGLAEVTRVLEHHPNNPLAATTGTFSGNVDVTGTVTADGMTVSPSSGAAIGTVKAIAGQTAYVSIRGNNTTFLTDSFDINQLSNGSAEVMQRANHPLIIGTNNTERLRIDSSGNVGINTTTMNAGLNIKQSADNAYQIKLEQINTTDGYGIICDMTDGALAFSRYASSAYEEHMRITDIGRVGIGTPSPNYLMELSDTGGGDTVTLALTNAGAHPARLRLNSGHGNWSVGNSVTVGDALEFRDESANTTNMIITSGGNVGIGTSSPQAGWKLHVNGAIQAENESFSAGRENASKPSFNFHDDTDTGIFNINPNILGFSTSGSERMRIAAVGLVTFNGDKNGVSDAQVNIVNDEANGLYRCLNLYTGVTTNRIVQTFFNGNGQVGYIATNGSSTSYVTSSDYRLKTAVNYDWDATTRLKQLRPTRFEWIADGDDAVPVDGFLAHEVQTVVPEAITGTHNEVDDDGNPVYQGIDQSKLVPLLVKTIQELEARITALENN